MAKNSLKHFFLALKWCKVCLSIFIGYWDSHYIWCSHILTADSGGYIYTTFISKSPVFFCEWTTQRLKIHIQNIIKISHSFGFIELDIEHQSIYLWSICLSHPSTLCWSYMQICLINRYELFVYNFEIYE